LIRRLLIANRGEIAIRIAKGCREMGIFSAAVFSEADRNSLHVQYVDLALPIGGESPSESYLDIAKILNAAREADADAIHPGYGFLSERPEFAQACVEAGITFIGPSPEAMRLLGDKISAKGLAQKCGVPITPGFFEPNATLSVLEERARNIGLPVMLKASAGGGGRGMRAVYKEDRLEAELQLASEEAFKAFGDGSMMVEKLIERPRHIEVQVLADSHGNVAPLFERECSLQRRHQKLLEECPSPVQHAFWDQMREASVRLIKESGYEGAGTVEFMLDPASGAIYFLEVNARLQVEHPVTEAVTGLDLVHQQIRVANGEKLGIPAELLQGDRKAIQGHAIEARIVAENPAADFLPSVGEIYAWAAPSSPGVRVDTGFAQGSQVTRFYDSLLAKVIVHAENRAMAIERLKGALHDFHILGVATNIEFLVDVVSSSGFMEGDFDTDYITREYADWKQPFAAPAELGSIVSQAVSPRSPSSAQLDSYAGPWETNDGWRVVRLSKSG